MLAQDIGAWSQLACKVFSATYGAAFPRETLVQYLESAFGIETLTETLVDPDMKVLGVWFGDGLVGFSQLSLGDMQACELVHMYVAVNQQGTGVANQLMKAILAVAAGPVWLYVWAHNARAIKFYQTWGFRQMGEVDLDFEGIPFHDLILQRSGDTHD